MNAFSTDTDILRYEPALFGDLHFPGQVLCQGSNGILEGVNFSAEGADFAGSGVGAGGVIYLSGGGLDGSYEIVSVESADSLTVSVPRADSEQQPISPGQGSALLYRISTFGPQANEAFGLLTRYFGIRPGQPAGEFGAEDILETEVLRQVSVYTVLAMIYGSIDNAQNDYKAKREYYERLAGTERQRCRVAVVRETDGRCFLLGGSMRLYRE